MLTFNYLVLKIEKFKVEEMKKCEEQDKMALKEQKELRDVELSNLKEELERAKKEHENHRLQLETNAKEDKAKFEEKLNELEYLLADSRKKVEELETFSESKSLRWKKKEFVYQNFIDDLLRALQVFVMSSAMLFYRAHAVLIRDMTSFNIFRN